MAGLCVEINEDNRLKAYDAASNTIMIEAFAKQCNTWKSIGTSRRLGGGYFEVGEACTEKCRLFPCVAVRSRRLEEMASRASYERAMSGEASASAQ